MIVEALENSGSTDREKASAELLRALNAARNAVCQGERDGVSHARMLLLLSYAQHAWEAWEAHRLRTGISSLHIA
jgi:hypothetical protein